MLRYIVADSVIHLQTLVMASMSFTFCISRLYVSVNTGSKINRFYHTVIIIVRLPHVSVFFFLLIPIHHLVWTHTLVTEPCAVSPFIIAVTFWFLKVHTPPTFEKMNSSETIVETETVSVLCKASGKPLPTYSWIKASTREDLATADRFSVVKNTGVLTIRDVSKDDDGEYKCVATNAAGKAERVVKINVVLKPRIVAYKNISIPTGQEARLSCSAFGRPMPTVTFR